MISAPNFYLSLTKTRWTQMKFINIKGQNYPQTSIGISNKHILRCQSFSTSLNLFHIFSHITSQFQLKDGISLKEQKTLVTYQQNLSNKVLRLALFMTYNLKFGPVWQFFVLFVTVFCIAFLFQINKINFCFMNLQNFEITTL